MVKCTNIVSVLLLISCFSVVNTYQHDKRGQWHVANDRDEKGNTALHRLACQCEELTIEEVYDILREYKLYSAWELPNPFIKNNDGMKADDIAFDKLRGNNAETCRFIAYIFRSMKEGYDQACKDHVPGSESEINHKYWRKNEEEMIARQIAREKEKSQKQ